MVIFLFDGSYTTSKHIGSFRSLMRDNVVSMQLCCTNRILKHRLQLCTKDMSFSKISDFIKVKRKGTQLSTFVEFVRAQKNWRSYRFVHVSLHLLKKKRETPKSIKHCFK